ncbi:MAG: hypothetical protein ACFBSC_06785 [Microcoleaceae cyanobacterium]
MTIRQPLYSKEEFAMRVMKFINLWYCLNSEKIVTARSFGSVPVTFGVLVDTSKDIVLQIIPVDKADSEPLIGMSLMEGYELKIRIFEGGCVELYRF